ncbi:cobyrinate a,c-diamide synthase [Rhodococcus sp. HNM0569]|nr:cobyrinate a,c-diamide synthase [Rhodococcus sp. HNM0569]
MVIAAPSSGSGKTTVATGLMGALRAEGHVVAPFKVGPDYIDPGYHALATGRPGRNLDPVLVGAERIGPLYRHGTAGAEVAVVEGVMGLFDGRIVPESVDPVALGSTAHVASLLGAPVVLVVDVRGQSQSLAALLHGFATYDASVRVAGVILNNVGSARHEDVLRAACVRAGLPVLGAVPRSADLAVPSRHLGLVTATEHGGPARAAVDAMTDIVRAHVDVAAVRTLADAAAAGPAWDARAETGGPGSTGSPAVRVALAAGAAFTFGYAEHRELLTAAGALVTEFDPATDRLPRDTAALILPGGFPEEHTSVLARNRRLLADVTEFVRDGGPVHAECAGMLYLARELDGITMAGALDVVGAFGPRLTLGYRDAVALADSPLYPAGARVTGHEFHRTVVEPRHSDTHPAAWAWRGVDGSVTREGFTADGLHASYLHTHPAGRPESITRFVGAARAFTGSA